MLVDTMSLSSEEDVSKIATAGRTVTKTYNEEDGGVEQIYVPMDVVFHFKKSRPLDEVDINVRLSEEKDHEKQNCCILM